MPQLDHAPRAGIPQRLRVGQVAADFVMRLLQVFGKFAAVDEQLAARADGRGERLDQDLAAARGGECLRAQLHLARGRAGHRELVHALIVHDDARFPPSHPSCRRGGLYARPCGECESSREWTPVIAVYLTTNTPATTPLPSWRN